MRGKASRFKIFIAAILFAVIVMLGGVAVLSTPVVKSRADAPSALKVHYVDVGQGDCTIIEFPDGKTMIIDGGDTSNAAKANIRNYISTKLPSGFKYFDYAMLTHSDSDHCGGLDDILEEYPAHVFFRPNVEATGSGYTDPGKDALPDGATKKNTVAYRRCITSGYKSNDDFTPVGVVTDPAKKQTITGGLGDATYTLEFFSPLSLNYKDWNNYSPIMVLEYRGYKFAMSGDAEKENENEFVAKVAAAKTDGVTDKYDIFTDDFCVNAIKTGHHGSRTSTSQAYIDVMTTPSGAKDVNYIISCGAGNKYGHPHSETITRLAGMSVPDENVLRTDLTGDQVLSVEYIDGGYKLVKNGVATSAVAAANVFAKNTSLPADPYAVFDNSTSGGVTNDEILDEEDTNDGEDEDDPTEETPTGDEPSGGNSSGGTPADPSTDSSTGGTSTGESPTGSSTDETSTGETPDDDRPTGLETTEETEEDEGLPKYVIYIIIAAAVLLVVIIIVCIYVKGSKKTKRKVKKVVKGAVVSTKKSSKKKSGKGKRKR